ESGCHIAREKPSARPNIPAFWRRAQGSQIPEDGIVQRGYDVPAYPSVRENLDCHQRSFLVRLSI
ncbi:MAG: hypothetical protein WBJ08_02570, partial [Kiritimatiellia bacterium]